MISKVVLLLKIKNCSASQLIEYWDTKENKLARSKSRLNENSLKKHKRNSKANRVEKINYEDLMKQILKNKNNSNKDLELENQEKIDYLVSNTADLKNEHPNNPIVKTSYQSINKNLFYRNILKKAYFASQPNAIYPMISSSSSSLNSISKSNDSTDQTSFIKEIRLSPLGDNRRNKSKNSKETINNYDSYIKCDEFPKFTYNHKILIGSPEIKSDNSSINSTDSSLIAKKRMTPEGEFEKHKNPHE